MEVTQKRAQYEPPKLEVQQLRELPSALAQSCRNTNDNHCRDTNGPGGIQLPSHILGN